MRRRPDRIREACQCLPRGNPGQSSGRVDRAAGIIRGVKVLSRESRNNRAYTPECLQKARRLYEGVSVRINHPEREGEEDRKSEDVLGRLVNVRAKPDGLYADLEYLKSHPMAARLCEAAERMPSAFGLSHNVDDWEGGYDQSGTYVVTEIRRVESVDLVADPATTKGLFESYRRRRKGKAMKLREWARKQKKAVRGEVARLLEAGAMAGDMLLEEGPTDPGEAVAAAFKAAVLAVLDDPASDAKAKLGKMKEILTSQEKLMASGALTPSAVDDAAPVEGDVGDDLGEPDGDDLGEPDGDELAEEDGYDFEAAGDDLEESEDEPEEEDEEMLESLKKENAALKRREECRRLCESRRVTPSPALLKALEALDDEGDRVALLKESRAGGSRRREADADEVRDGASFAAAITE